MMKKYLNDSAKEEAELLKESILGGAVLSEVEQVRITTLIATLMQAANIDIEEIEDFYAEEE